MRDVAPPPGGTRRQAEKARRRSELLAAAGRLFGTHGYRAVALSDIGREVGVSGQAIYRHFASKQDLLAHLLLDVSQWLLDSARASRAAEADAGALLNRLIQHHVDFALEHAGVIGLQERELAQLDSEARRRVRRLQRDYAEIWSTALAELHPEDGPVDVRTRVHGIFGLINSTTHSLRAPRPTAHGEAQGMSAAGCAERGTGRTAEPDDDAEATPAAVLREMARAAAHCPIPPSGPAASRGGS